MEGIIGDGELTRRADLCAPIRSIPFNGYYAIQGQNFDPPFDQNEVPLPNQSGYTQGDPSCILITLTNQEINN